MKTMTTTTRAASKLLALAGLVMGTMAMAACSGAPVERPEETTASAEEKMRCASGTSCAYDPPVCDPTTTCCWGGGALMGGNPCGSLLYGAGCRGATRGTNYADAVENDGYGHWWFEVYCPNTQAAYDAAHSGTCLIAHTEWNFGGNYCTTSLPPVGQVDVIYDPTCGSGCTRL